MAVFRPWSHRPIPTARQTSPETVEISRLLQSLERSAIRAQTFEVIVQAEQRLRIQNGAP